MKYILFFPKKGKLLNFSIKSMEEGSQPLLTGRVTQTFNSQKYRKSAKPGNIFFIYCNCKFPTAEKGSIL